MIVLLIFSQIICNFKRIYSEKDRKETVKGKIYYFIPNNFYIEVKEPLMQAITKKTDTLFIYYPKEKRGFKILTYPHDLPLGMNFLSFQYMKGDTLFKEAGFIFVRKAKRKDTIITEWTTKGKIKRNYVIKKLKDKITEILIKGEKDIRCG